MKAFWSGLTQIKHYNPKSQNMKLTKALLYSLILLALNSATAQKKIVWFDAGLKGQIGNSSIFNKAVYDAENVNYELGLTSGYSVGGKLGINFEYSGLAIDVMYATGSNIFTRSGQPDGNIKHNWNAIDVYPLFRNARNLGYLELGPKVSLLNKMERTDAQGTTDVKEEFNNINYGAVLGFGVNLIGGEGAFSGIIGLRMEYGFTDIVSKAGKIENAPTNLGNIYDQGYQSSHQVFAGIVAEFNWGIGYFGRAKCGARSKFIMF